MSLQRTPSPSSSASMSSKWNSSRLENEFQCACGRLSVVSRWILTTQNYLNWMNLIFYLKGHFNRSRKWVWNHFNLHISQLLFNCSFNLSISNSLYLLDSDQNRSEMAQKHRQVIKLIICDLPVTSRYKFHFFLSLFCFLEMRPQWFDCHQIPFSQMWADDVLWFPLLLQKKKFVGYFKFQGHDVILSQSLEEVKELWQFWVELHIQPSKRLL